MIFYDSQVFSHLQIIKIFLCILETLCFGWNKAWLFWNKRMGIVSRINKPDDDTAGDKASEHKYANQRPACICLQSHCYREETSGSLELTCQLVWTRLHRISVLHVQRDFNSKKNNNNNKGKGYLTLTSGLFEHLHAHMHTCTHHTHSVSVYPCLFLSLPLSGDTLTVTESVTSTGGLDRDLKVHLNFYNYN